MRLIVRLGVVSVSAASVRAFCGALLGLIVGHSIRVAILGTSRMDKGLLHEQTLALRTGNSSHRSVIWGEVVLQATWATFRLFIHPTDQQDELGDFMQR